MKLPKNYFENLSASKYREYLKLLPNMRKESNKAITMLIFTFFALSFLGLFAINPTLSTIIELNKQLEESQFVHEQLTIKMNNLSKLQEQYTLLSDELPLVYEAIPQNAQVIPLIGQIQSLAQEQDVAITSFRIEQVKLVNTKQLQKGDNSFLFALEVQGEYEAMTEFVASLTNFNRLVTIDSISITKDPRRNILILTVLGKPYFKP